jgi:hypothetical protein
MQLDHGHGGQNGEVDRVLCMRHAESDAFLMHKLLDASWWLSQATETRDQNFRLTSRRNQQAELIVP